MGDLSELRFSRTRGSNGTIFSQMTWFVLRWLSISIVLFLRSRMSCPLQKLLVAEEESIKIPFCLMFFRAFSFFLSFFLS